jgi:hypothetical protein
MGPHAELPALLALRGLLPDCQATPMRPKGRAVDKDEGRDKGKDKRI